MTTTPSGPTPGWYPHPTMTNTQRYWDGRAWTDHIAPGAAAASQPQSVEDPMTGLRLAAIIGALLMPIVGAICAVVLIAKGKTGIGVGTLILSIISFLFWANALFASSGSSSYGGY